MRKVLQPTSNFASLLKEKRGFLALVYLTLALQLSLTYGMYKIIRSKKEWTDTLNKYIVIWVLLSIGTILLFAFMSLPLPLAMLLVVIFSLLQGLLILFLITKRNIPENVIRAAIFSVVAIFVLTTLVGFFLTAIGINLSFMYFGLMMILIALLVVTVVNVFFLKSKLVHRVLVSISILLFTIFLVVDTNAMLQRDYLGTFLDAAMNLYIDIINLFIDFLAIFSD